MVVLDERMTFLKFFYDFSMTLNRKMTKKIQFEKNLVETKKPKIFEKKNSRQRHTIGLTDFLIHYK